MKIKATTRKEKERALRQIQQDEGKTESYRRYRTNQKASIMTQHLTHLCR